MECTANSDICTPLLLFIILVKANDHDQLHLIVQIFASVQYRLKKTAGEQYLHEGAAFLKKKSNTWYDFAMLSSRTK